MTRRMSPDGLAMIKRFEGLRLKAYLDIVGVLTIGYGSTGPHVRSGMVITEREAEVLLVKDLFRFEEAVERLVKVPLTENQFGALVSFAFNLGSGALQKSTLLKLLNKGDYDAVPRELMKFVNAGGKRVQGLVNRRAAEAGLWSRGAYVASNFVTVDPVKPKTIAKSKTGNTAIGVGIGGAAVIAGQAREGAQIARDISDSLGVSIGLLIGIALVAAAAFIWWKRRQALQEGEA